MADERQSKGAGSAPAPARLAPLVAVLPRLEARDTEARSDFIKAVHDVIGLRQDYRLAEREDWENASAEECRLALVWLWRAEYWTSNQWGPSVLDIRIKDGFAARVLRRLIELEGLNGT